jgi:hypothetical protein
VYLNDQYLTQIYSFFFKFSWGGVRLSPFGTSAAICPTVSTPVDDDECGEVD